jgi:hypothetical protein
MHQGLGLASIEAVFIEKSRCPFFAVGQESKTVVPGRSRMCWGKKWRLEVRKRNRTYRRYRYNK